MEFEYASNRKMPKRLDFGQHEATAMCSPLLQWKDFKQDGGGRERRVMGYRLPSWQRPLVWSNAQKVKLLESAWLGLSIGTYTFNRSDKEEYDDLLIDGQQRLNAIQEYLSDAFPVFGHRYSEITDADRRVFEMTVHFHSFITTSNDEEYLRGYYNMMNFGGTAHKETERA